MCYLDQSENNTRNSHMMSLAFPNVMDLWTINVWWCYSGNNTTHAHMMYYNHVYDDAFFLSISQKIDYIEWIKSTASSYLRNSKYTIWKRFKFIVSGYLHNLEIICVILFYFRDRRPTEPTPNELKVLSKTFKSKLINCWSEYGFSSSSKTMNFLENEMWQRMSRSGTSKLVPWHAISIILLWPYAKGWQKEKNCRPELPQHQSPNNVCFALSLYSLIWDFLLSQINIWTTTTWSNVWVVLPKPSWYEFLIGFLIWTPASKYLHLTTFSNICVILSMLLYL